jgi:hypothetical protein
MITWALWLAVASGPAVWIAGLFQLAGTGRLSRFALAYPLWMVVSGALLMWASTLRPDRHGGAAIASGALWLILVGPIAAIALALLLRRERRRR